MSTMNPLKFMGGLVLEIGAVIAVLAIIPGLGGSESLRLTGANTSPASSFANNSLAPMTNQVFFDAQSSRVLDEPNQQRTAWQNDLIPPPPAAQQRYVEEMLDHNSQRALDAATRLWTQGDRLLPPDLRVRREAADQHAGEPIRDLSQRRPAFRADDNRADNEIVPEYVVPPAVAEQNYNRPSHYAPPQNRPTSRYSPPRYSAQEQPRRVDERY